MDLLTFSCSWSQPTETTQASVFKIFPQALTERSRESCTVGVNANFFTIGIYYKKGGYTTMNLLIMIAFSLVWSFLVLPELRRTIFSNP